MTLREQGSNNTRTPTDATSTNSCPFEPKLMVVVLQMVLCVNNDDRGAGIGVIEALTPDERLHLFSACRWFNENPEWDRWTYSEGDN